MNKKELLTSLHLETRLLAEAIEEYFASGERILEMNELFEKDKELEMYFDIAANGLWDLWGQLGKRIENEKA